MKYTTLISAIELNKQLGNPNWVIVDCRFSLVDIHAGPKAYRFGHIPNAIYANLNNDLSSAITSFTGRHPLPNIAVLTRKLGQWGINNASQIVVYDDASGAFAARLWWLLRWLGHNQVAVLDGGIPQWKKQGFAVTTTLPTPKSAAFRAYVDNSLWLTANQVQNNLARRTIRLLDARTPERYQGKQEPVDPVAGHIPGALNRPFNLNMDKNGLFLSPDQLKQQFQTLMSGFMPEQIVHQCGSGVTACHNLLAMEHAGLTGSKLYAGSWSEWIRDKNRPIVKG